MKLTVPNALSILRMGLVPLFIIATMDGKPLEALLVMVLAGITDALDGAIARFYHQQTLLGSYLDPIADKLLLISAYVVLAIPSMNPGTTIPAWVTVLVIARDVVIVVVALVLALTVGARRFPPSRTSKVTTTAQVTTVILVLISGFWPSWSLVARLGIYTVAVLTVVSGVQYAYRVSRLAEQREPPAEPSSS